MNEADFGVGAKFGIHHYNFFFKGSRPALACRKVVNRFAGVCNQRPILSGVLWKCSGEVSVGNNIFAPNILSITFISGALSKLPPVPPQWIDN